MTTGPPRPELADTLDGATALGVSARPDQDVIRGSMLRLAERFRPEDADALTAAWVIDVDGHGAYTIHVRNGRCLISPGATDRPSVRLETDPGTWLDMVAGRTDGLGAFMRGAVRISGDLHLALRLESLFRPGPEAVRLVRSLRTRVRGHEIASVVAGHGTPILLLHGLAANKLSFAPTLDGLSDAYEVHALDLPGFGRSDKPLPRGKRYSAAWMADMVDGYMVENGMREAYLVGNSMGGRIATEVALRHPRKVRGVIGLGSAVAFDEWQRFGPLLRLLRTQWLGVASLPIRREWVESLMRDLLFHDPSAIPSDNMRAGADDVLASFADRGYRMAVTACTRHLTGERARGRRGYWTSLEKLAVPSYWIWGEADRLVSCRYAERVRETLPHAQVEVWEHVGHVPQFEAPQRTNESIRRFVQRIEAGY